MPRLRTTFAVLAGLVLAMAAIAPAALAQDETTSEHPVIGSWIVDPTPTIEDDAPELITFHVEGAIRGAGPNGPSAGAWEATGERSADALGLYFGTDPTTGSFLGLATVRVSLEVSEDGQTFSGTYTFEPPAAFAEAMGIPMGELGPGEVTGQRISVEPMGEPVAPIPDFGELQPPQEPSEPQGDATPPTEEPMPPAEATPPPVGESPAPIEATQPPVEATAPPVEATMPPTVESPPPGEQESPSA